MEAVTKDLVGQRCLDSSGNRSSLHILLPRQDLSAAKSAIAKAAASLDGPDLPGFSLTMTGLWPPYGFVTAPKAAAVVPA
jgi:hypothetical protein